MDRPQATLERIPTESSYKMRILSMIDDITETYNTSFYNMQVAVYQGHADRELVRSLYIYITQIISLYKMLKPKVVVAQAKDPKFEELQGMDEYVRGIDELKGGFDMNDAFVLFQVFNIYEDLLRELCETLGYTSDKPNESR